jgi:hypothetical protein
MLTPALALAHQHSHSHTGTLCAHTHLRTANFLAEKCASALRDVDWTSKDDVNDDVNKQEGSEKYDSTSVVSPNQENHNQSGREVQLDFSTQAQNDPTTLPALATPEKYAG